MSNVENFDIFLAFARLSTENYNQLLIAWSDLDLEKDLKFHGGESTYDAGEPEERRQYIIDTFGWEINDGGLAVPLYRLELIAEPAEGGSVSGGGEFAEDEVVRIEATPEQGWGFIQWSDAEGDMISSEEAFDYTMPAGHMTLTATFDDEVSVSDPAVIQAKVYPNPATDFVQVKAESRVVSYRLTDENGRSVRVQDVGASAFYIPLSGLNPGVYFLELQSDKGKASHRIILMP